MGSHAPEVDGEEKENKEVVVVGNYCHDTLKLGDGRVVEALGGSVSYITNVFYSLGMKTTTISKVGMDFKYYNKIQSCFMPTRASEDTVSFIADFTLGPERVLTCPCIGAAITSSDIPSSRRFSIAVAAGIAGEVTPAALAAVCDQSHQTVADIQALIRTIDPCSGSVSLTRIEGTPFAPLLSCLSFVKASEDEAGFIDLEQARKVTGVVMTHGDGGCTVYYRDKAFRVPAFQTKEIDPTGAGDSFLAGFTAGLFWDLPVEKAALVGNFFGAISVSQVGVPQFSSAMIRSVELYLRSSSCNGNGRRDSLSAFPSQEEANASIYHDQEVLSRCLNR